MNFNKYIQDKYQFTFKKRPRKNRGRPQPIKSKKCKLCSEIFLGKNLSKYCSGCKIKRKQKPTFTICRTCSESFKYKPNVKYCSRSCSMATNFKKGPKFITHLINCIQCNKLVPCINNKKRFCSQTCWSKYTFPNRFLPKPPKLPKIKIKPIRLCSCGKALELRKQKCVICVKRYIKKERIVKYYSERKCKHCNIEFRPKHPSALYCKRNHRPDRIKWRKKNNKSPGRIKQSQRRKWVTKHGQGISKFFIFELIQIYCNRPLGYHVDHIMPLNHPLHCGLHVPWNLQYLKAEDNIKKSNKLDYECNKDSVITF